MGCYISMCYFLRPSPVGQISTALVQFGMVCLVVGGNSPIPKTLDEGTLKG